MKHSEPGYFGKYLDSIIQDERARGIHVNAKIMALRLGITPAMMARFLSGESKGCYPETLGKMVEGISEDPKIQAGLVRAYLLDQRPPNTSHLVAVISIDESKTDSIDAISDLAREFGLTSDLVHAICEIIKGCSKSPRMAQVVTDLGNISEFDLTPKTRNHRSPRS